MRNIAYASFLVSFEPLRPTNLQAGFEMNMEPSSSQSISIPVFDQFDDPFLNDTTIEWSVTDGTLDVYNVSASTGSASVYKAGVTEGPAFITLTVAGSSVEIVLDIQVARAFGSWKLGS